MQAVEPFGLIHIPATEREIPTEVMSKQKRFQGNLGDKERDVSGAIQDYDVAANCDVIYIITENYHLSFSLL